jgi:hypothetical protein
MPSDEQDTCPICKRRFVEHDSDEEDERVTTCGLCLGMMHKTCNVTHACPCEAPTDTEKLKAWEKACADA